MTNRFMVADWRVFDFGAAGFLGSMGGKSLSAPVVGMGADGGGYWLVGGSGAVYRYEVFAFPLFGIVNSRYDEAADFTQGES